MLAWLGQDCFNKNERISVAFIVDENNCYCYRLSYRISGNYDYFIEYAQNHRLFAGFDY
jgi:hypothetical protein